MSGTVVNPESRARRRAIPALLTEVRNRLQVGVRALILGGVALLGGCSLLAVPLALLPGLIYTTHSFTLGPDGHLTRVLVLSMVGVVFAIPIAALGPRLTAWLTRQLAARWCGVEIPSPYQPYAEHRATAARGFRGRIGWFLADPATWRDALWTGLVGTATVTLGMVPADLVRAVVDKLIGFHPSGKDMFDPRVRASAKFAEQIDWWMSSRFQLDCLTLAVTALVLGLLFHTRFLTAYGAFARVLLSPTRQAELARRVHHLAETRSATLDTGAAAMRQIERDLHDGAQARLVATGMTLGAAEGLIDTDPAAARALLVEARESSAKALAELRDLVRGIHPPVLADRGLVEALRALALDLPLRVHVAEDLRGRPPAPVESAAYFTASELLANVVKHAAARQAWLDIRHTGGALRIGVTDDGRGGADPSRGTGLRGVERRLAAFDGVLAVSSPLGGPTVVNLEIPCALSSPKTSTS